jgi:hypothetical protein
VVPAAKAMIAALCVAFACAGTAAASGGDYVFQGGTAAEHAQVRAALEASMFNWSLVPVRVTIRIARGSTSDAIPGEIFLDARLVDSGRFAWGVVQHEYAHQFDYFVLDGARRDLLAPALGGSAWWQPAGAKLRHCELTSERFASTLAWAYWPSPDNTMRPRALGDESGAISAPAFRRLLTEVFGLPLPARSSLALSIRR